MNRFLAAVRAAPDRFYWELSLRSSGWLPGDGRIVANSELV
jgi:hypothetical protein